MKKIYLLAVIALMTQFSFGAELFVRVNRSGVHVATAFNQTQTNSSNTYRFFDLPGGYVSLKISDQQTGYSVYNGSVNVASNQRVVAEIDYYGNLQIIQTIAITNSNWYTSTPGTAACTTPVSYPNNGGGYPNYGGNFPNNGYPTNAGGYYPPQNSNDAAFQQFLVMLNDEPFDSNKLDFAKGYANKTMLSAQQVADISKKFTYDSNRLDWTKQAYSRCYDKANYFLMKSTFTFSSNYSALEDYIEGL